MAFMIQRDYSAASVQTKVSGLSYVHTTIGWPNPAVHFLIKKMLKGSKKLRCTRDARLPITLPILRALIKVIPRLQRESYYQKMYKAMFLLAFHALLRVSEFTTRGKQLGHAIQKEDVSIEASKGTLSTMHVRIRHFKHSKGPVTLSLKAHPSALCPVHALSNYLLVRHPYKGPLFINQDSTPVTSYQFTSFLHQAVSDIGLNARLYKPHSFRIGGATLAHQTNMSESQIKALGRWGSSSYMRYIRVPVIPTL